MTEHQAGMLMILIAFFGVLGVIGLMVIGLNVKDVYDLLKERLPQSDREKEYEGKK